ncbi:MAG: hypothetical protein J3Q66DRAFT_369820 [Benniella sp.]|nr:MAG: hypothetical protein J3Q66DRAFT_369820 [Benniella sp.]
MSRTRGNICGFQGRSTRLAPSLPTFSNFATLNQKHMYNTWIRPALSHIRLILLNRTTIEDHSTPYDEGVFPCVRNGWATSEGEANQGNERLYDLGLRANWEQAMGKGWRCLLPVRFPLPEGPVHNKKVVERQMRDLYQQEETRQQQQQEHPPHRYRRMDENDAMVGFERSSPLENEIDQNATVGSAVSLQEDAPSSSAKASESSSS